MMNTAMCQPPPFEVRTGPPRKTLARSSLSSPDGPSGNGAGPCVCVGGANVSGVAETVGGAAGYDAPSVTWPSDPAGSGGGAENVGVREGSSRSGIGGTAVGGNGAGRG